MVQEYLKQFFEEIDFLPQGEKIALLENTTNEIKGIARGKNTKRGIMRSEPFGFIADATKEELNLLVKKLQKKQKAEAEKLEEIKYIFTRYSARIGKERLKAIPYPEGLKTIPTNVGANGKMLFFTCDGMKKWFASKVSPDMKPFKETAKLKVENNILEHKAFGLANLWEDFGTRFASKKLMSVDTVQKIVFYKTHEWTRISKGIAQPLKKVNFIMLFLILKYAFEQGFQRVEFNLRENAPGITERQVYRDIGAVADQYDEEEWKAAFRRR